jgi:hypothetical protein
MVHALEEVRRVLVPGGVLIDLRPLTDSWPVEIASGADGREAGRLTDLPAGRADDQAANGAIEEASRRGWFLRQHEQTFPLFYYWDTPAGMEAFVEDEWDGVAELDEATARQMRASWASANAAARIRVRVKMLLTRWVRQ